MSVVRQRQKWVARVWGADGKRHSRTFTLKSDAQRWEREEARKSERGELPSATRRDTRTVGSIGDQWVLNLAERDLKPKTITGYESLWRTIVRPHWGSQKPRTVQAVDIRDWLLALESKSGKPLSKSRKTQAHQVLAMVLDEAVFANVISVNPARNGLVSRGMKGTQTRQAKPHSYLSPMELRNLAAIADDYGDLVFFLGTSGLRWAEATALTVKDFDGAKVVVNKSATEVGGHRTIVPTKSGQDRTVVLPAVTISRVQHLLLNKEPGDLVFKTRSGAPVMHGNFYNRIWRPSIREAGMEGLRIHDLRHTATSLAVSSGANVKHVANMLGHSDVAQTLNRYAGLFTDHLEAVADRMDVLFAESDVQQPTNTASIHPMRKKSM